MRAVPALVAALLLASLAAAAPADGERRIASGLATPAEVAFRADGGLLYAELGSGKVRLLRDEGASPTTVATVPSSPGGNGGFTGLAVDPADPRVLYVVYSFEKDGAPNGKVNRVSRLAEGAETVLLDDVPWAEFHVGGRVAVGPDGFLYVTTGDNGDYRRQPGDYPGDPAQDPQSLKGKVLRLGKDGAPAGGVAGWNPYVYARGFRNPFGLAFGPDGTVYVAENGIRHDEVNVLVQGANYGWPACDGDCPGYQKPLLAWPDSFGTTGMAYLDGKLYVGDYSEERLRVVDAATGATAVSWATRGDPVLGVAAGPDGCLYVSSETAVYQVDVRGAGGCDLEVRTTPPPTPTPPSPTPASPTPTSPTPASPTPASPAPPTPTPPPPTPTSAPPSPSPGPLPTTTAPPTATPAPSPVTTETPGAPANASPNETNRTPQESIEEGNDTPGPGIAALLAALAAAGALARRRRGA